MMEGLFVWFEGDDFLGSELNWLWRGERHHLRVSDFLNRYE